MNKGYKAVANKLHIAPEVYTQITERLHQNPRNAIGITNEIAELIPQARERQIYKLMYPLVQFEAQPQLIYLTKKFIIEPLLENDYQLLRSPNQYSILLMSYGFQFITDPKFLNKRAIIPEGPSTPIQNREGSNGRPFRFSIFHRFQRDFLENHMELIKGNKDFNLLVYILHIFVLNSSLQVDAILSLVDYFAENLKED